MCICDYVEDHIGSCAKFFFDVKNGISELLHWVAQKHTSFI